MTVSEEIEADIKRTFFPRTVEAEARVRAQGNRFVYYTTASTALQIIEKGEIWMRNTMVMNDFSEVAHGLACVAQAYDASAGKALRALLDKEYAGVSEEIEHLYNSWVPGFRKDTFVTCFSEHLQEDDRNGRLSMWRAYGGTAGVALVLNGDVFFKKSTALAVYSSPVSYMGDDSFDEALTAVAHNVSKNSALLRHLGRDFLKNTMFTMLRFAAVCTKHPAFLEEKEWRVISSPSIQKSPLLPICLEAVGGIPQKVLKIRLEDHPDKGLVGLKPELLLNRVLIGPCEHAEVVSQALAVALKNAGVQNPESFIHQTGIPLRSNQR